MKRLLCCVTLALLLGSNVLAGGEPPVGQWEAKVGGSKAQVVFVFSPDQTLFSYGLSTLQPGGLIQLTGTWNNVSGRLTGAFQQTNPPLADQFTFTGSASSTALKFRVKGPNGGFGIKCTPLDTAADVAGVWNVQTRTGTPIDSPITITASNELPHVFTMTSPMTNGVMMVNLKGKAVAFFQGASFRGKFDLLNGTGSFKGRDASSDPVRITLELAP